MMPTALIVARSSASACGEDLERRASSGLSLSARGSILRTCMRKSFPVAEPAFAGPSCLHFIAKTSPGPQSGPTDATAPEHPCCDAQAGLTALRGASGRDCDDDGSA